jgi:hypothetical protein
MRQLTLARNYEREASMLRTRLVSFAAVAALIVSGTAAATAATPDHPKKKATQTAQASNKQAPKSKATRTGTAPAQHPGEAHERDEN